MSRNANGDYSLPAGNPVVTDTTISSAWANPTMEDIGNELTNSLDRNGRGGMLVPFQNVDGTVLLPGITFTLEPTSGIYRFGASDLRMSVNGKDAVKYIDASAQTAGQQQPILAWDGLTFEPLITNSSINLSSPPAIGNVTPNSGAFTTFKLSTGVTVDDISNDGALTDGSATALVTENAVKTYVQANINQFDASSPPPIGDVAPDTGRFSIFSLATGTTITDISIDSAFTGNSDNSVVTEKAIKAYIATQPVGFDPSSPSPIGNVAPNTVEATTLTSTDLTGVGNRGIGVDASGNIIVLAAESISNAVLSAARTFSYNNF